MSRAINISLSEAVVSARCEKDGVRISAIEVLPSGGTHLVCVTSEGAEEMRTAFAKNLIAGKVKRFPFYRS
ncbi:MAG: hypothetical protein KGL44_08875 [Sphingomonadales bacterium]|nr:hypothetical protein [Sphingomonadales bacterium]